MNGLDQAITHLADVRAHLRRKWVEATDIERQTIKDSEHKVSLALQILTEEQQRSRQRRNGVPWRVR